MPAPKPLERGELPAAPADSPAAAVPAALKLVIWDLDETFWRGTLEEGGIHLIERNIAIVQTLSARGIINSIASKNHHDRVRPLLEQAGVWEHFVLPRIAFAPKGELVKHVIELCQLRAPNVLFIDDNTINLNEVAHYNPGIQLALPDVLDGLLDEPRARGAADPDFSRLRKYKIIEQREADRQTAGSDNTAFLRASHIRVSIHHDVLDEFPRVHELVNRTNQLNFTKNRLPEDIETAYAEMEITLTRAFNVRAAYIKVADNYGYYGICGFYMMHGNKVEHFLFSCRILNMGVEQLIYQKIGRPRLPADDAVVSDPGAAITPDWITIVDDAQNDSAAPQTELAGTICMRGACELSQTAHYLRERHKVEEEFPFPRGDWAIVTPLSDYVALKPAFEDPDRAAVFAKPWFDPTVMQSRIFDRSADIYILSFGQEPNVFRYRHKRTGLIFPINLSPFNTKDLTRLDYQTVAEKCDVRMTAAEWTQMQEEFECLWRFDADTFERNLTAMLDLIVGKRVIILLANTRFGPYERHKDNHEHVNDVIRRVAYPRPITLISLDDVVRSDSEMLEMNHFRREVYQRMAQVLRDALAMPAPEPAAAAAPMPAPGPRRNLLPTTQDFSAEAWRSLHGAHVAIADIEPLFAGTAVLRHELPVPVGEPRPTVFACRINRLTPGQYYTASAYLMIPAEFRGRTASLVIPGQQPLATQRLSPATRDSWQRVSVTAQFPLEGGHFRPTLIVRGEPGDVVYSTGWKLESGRDATDYVPSAARFAA